MAHLPHRAIKSRNLAERCWSDLAESGTLCRDNVGGRRGDSALRADFSLAPCVGAIESGGHDTARRARRQTTASWTVASRNGISGLYESIDRYHRPIGARHTSEYRSVCPRPVASDL